MKNRFTHTAPVLAASLLAVSCELRPLYTEGETAVNVVVLTDWTQLGGSPAGATICFYPEDRRTPWVFSTNSVSRTMVKVPSGYYTVQVFNRTEGEFSSLKFTGMGALESARAVLEDRFFPWVGRSDTVARTVCEPEEIVIGRTDHFLVRSISEREAYFRGSGSKDDVFNAVIDSVTVVPRLVRYSGTVSLRVRGIQNIRSVRGYLTGMAGDVYMATRYPGDSLATHVLENWAVEKDADDYTKGYVRASFSCFGLPERYVGNPHPGNNRLLVQFSLVDGRTVVQEILDVGSDIRQNDFERTDEIVAGREITIPDVVPEGGAESGFDVSVTDWDEPVEIPIGV